jgi:site-specific DNA-methyltransferase (adenine-specific)
MITITNEDNLEMMKRYPDNHFHLAIIDPPYGIQNSKSFPVLGKLSIDSVRIRQCSKSQVWDVEPPSQEFFDELFRVSKHQIIWGMQYFADKLPAFSSLIIWDKQNGDTLFADGEAAYCSIKGTLRIWKHLWCGAAKESERGAKVIHINQKPVQLYKWLLAKYAKPGQRILDTHLGSGSIAIACHDMGFDLTACEIDKEYFESATTRLRLHQEQKTLFSEIADNIPTPDPALIV